MHLEYATLVQVLDIIMAFPPQNFSGATINYGSGGTVPHKQMPNPSPQPADNPNGCFDCNICLDSSHDPVVTLCGHLYCWPCIYKWLKVQNSSADGSDESPKCPVCKSHISTSTLIPLYGRGMFGPEAKKPGPLDSTVPHRPPGLGNYQNHQNHQNPFEPDNRAYQQHHYLPRSFAGPSSRSFYSPTINMVGELVFARMFRSQETNMFDYPYSNYGHLSRNGSLRLRRQEMRLDKSLNRVSIFLLCCIILCLILF